MLAPAKVRAAFPHLQCVNYESNHSHKSELVYQADAGDLFLFSRFSCNGNFVSQPCYSAPTSTAPFPMSNECG